MTYYVVDLVEKGQDALDRAAAEDDDAVLLDLGLPDIQGEVVLTTLRARELSTKKHLPIIIATAHGLEADLVACPAKGADAAFIKPMSIEILHQALDQVW